MGECPAGECPVGECPAGECPVGEWAAHPPTSPDHTLFSQQSVAGHRYLVTHGNQVCTGATVYLLEMLSTTIGMS